MKTSSKWLAALALVAAGGAAVIGVHQRTPSKASAAAVAGGSRVPHVRASAELQVGRALTPDALRTAWGDTSDPVARIAMLNSAAHLVDADRLAFLVDVAASDDPVAAHAAAAIGSITSPRVAEQLVAIVASHQPVIVRANAARALGRAGSAQDAPALLGVVGDSSADLRTRQESALALGHVGDANTASALGALLDSLATDTTAEQLRISIIQALGGLNTDVAIAALERHRGRDLSATERAFVDHAIGAAQPTT